MSAQIKFSMCDLCVDLDSCCEKYPNKLITEITAGGHSQTLVSLYMSFFCSSAAFIVLELGTLFLFFVLLPSQAQDIKSFIWDLTRGTTRPNKWRTKFQTKSISVWGSEDFSYHRNCHQIVKVSFQSRTQISLFDAKTPGCGRSKFEISPFRFHIKKYRTKTRFID